MIRILTFSSAIFWISFMLLIPAFAAPNELKLDSASSKVDISVNSQVLNTSGSLTDYSGIFIFNPQDLRNSRLEINADTSKVAFGTLPIEQMILLTGLIRSNPNPDVSFTSEFIEQPSPKTILVTGTALAGRSRESITIPFELSELSQSSAILRGSYDRTGLIGGKNNPRSKLFGNVSCRSIFKLVFKK